MKSILKIALKNIFKHKGKNSLIAIIIFIANITFFLTAALTHNSTLSWRAYLSKTFMGTYHLTTLSENENDYAISSMGLPKTGIEDKVLTYLRTNNIDYSGRIRTGGAYYNDKSGVFEGNLITVIGADINNEIKHLSNLMIVDNSAKEFPKDGALVWHELCEQMNWKIGDSITIYLKDSSNSIYPYSFTIAGMLNQKQSAGLEDKGVIVLFPLIFVNYTYLADLLNISADKVMEVAIWDNNYKYEKNIKDIIKFKNINLFYAEKGFGTLYGISEFITFFGLVLQIIVLVVLIIATFNVNIISFFERQKEIGTILAIGAKPLWAIMLLLSELIIFSFIVSALSLSVYFIISLLIGNQIDLKGLSVILAGNKLSLTFIPISLLVANLAICCSLMLSALYPCYLTLKINPAEVFRETNI